MSAVSPRMLERQTPISPPALDDYDKAIFEKKYDKADNVLELIYKKHVPEAIQNETIRIRATLTVMKIEWGIIQKFMPTQLVKGAVEKALCSHDFDLCLELIVQGADLQVQTSTGQSLLHVAVEEYYQRPIVEQVLENGDVLPIPRTPHILHVLLEAGLDPNCQDVNGITPLAKACKKGDLYAVYLLLTYGAVPSKEAFEDLRQATIKRDPLYISAGDSLLFATTCTSWLARGILAYTGSNAYIDAAVDAVSIAGTVGYLASEKPSWSKVICAAALELVPTTRVYTQLAKTACVAASAFTGLIGVYNNYVDRSWDAFKKMTVVSVNSLASFSEASQVIAAEYTQSQICKKAQDMSLPIKDIDAQPTWTCDNYQKLFREASRVTHPDKLNGNTAMQIALVAARDFMKKTC